jgi:hypothetical protein
MLPLGAQETRAKEDGLPSHQQAEVGALEALMAPVFWTMTTRGRQ